MTDPDLCEVAAHLEREGCARIADAAMEWFQTMNQPQGDAMAAAAEEIAVRIRAQTDPVGQHTRDFVAALSAAEQARDEAYERIAQFVECNEVPYEGVGTKYQLATAIRALQAKE